MRFDLPALLLKTAKRLVPTSLSPSLSLSSLSLSFKIRISPQNQFLNIYSCDDPGIFRYLVTTFKVVPRGTEGAVSVEGTVAGLLASILLAGVGYIMGEVNILQAAICVVASQIANFGESLIGASLQDKEGFQWLNNDLVNVINISIGSILAILIQQLLGSI